MQPKDLDKLNRLCDTIDLNYRLTRMYATYLERFPQIITEDVIEQICDGDIDKKSAIVALLCELFALNTEENADDRRIAREYISESVRILDAKRYTENKYYKNISIPEVCDGNWEFKKEHYPPYRAVICDDLIIKNDFREIPPLGFFEEEFAFPAVLEDGNEWMTLTPVDLDTSEEAIREARGDVITFGLGLGYYTYMCSEKSEVNSITVVEKSENVIRLFEKYILPQFSHPGKVKIVNADAFYYAEFDMPRENYTVAFVDTWRDASDGTPMYIKMKALEHLSPNTKFIYWIENFLISRERALRFDNLMKLVEGNSVDAPKNFDEFVKELTKR